MKVKLLAVAALAAMALAACSKDNEKGGQTTNPEEGIFIQFTGLNEPNSRTLTDPVADNTPVTLDKGYLVFGDVVSDKVTHVVAIGTSTPTDPAVTVNALENGMVFSGIEATHVYVIGNLNGVTVQIGDNLASLLANTVDVLDQTDVTGGLSTATLFGLGQIDPATNSAAVAAGATKQAIFSVRPVAARLELSKISASAGTDGNVISYKLSGIYINNFYLELGINGSIVDANPYPAGKHVDFQDDHTRYLPSGGGYLSAWNGKLFDGLAVSSDTNLEILSEDVDPGKVWAYNVLAPYGNGNSKAAVPHIVLHFTEMTLDYDPTPAQDGSTETSTPGEYLFYNSETNTDGECYLTITRYIQDLGQANEADLAIDAGFIYKITDVPFTPDDLGELPETDPEIKDGFKVYVQVTFVPWQAKNVTGGW
ncbi:MAG: hypothetical protein LUE26_11025 [Alistipes sp.]|nr:hypothetical protein [Alistipes sp.]